MGQISDTEFPFLLFMNAPLSHFLLFQAELWLCLNLSED